VRPLTDHAWGLGLATVYGIVKQSGGYLTVYSETGQGAAFKIYLPWAGEAPAPRQKAAELIESLSGSESILLVEDDPAVRRTCVRVLRNSGYDMVEAADGNQGLNIVQQRATPFDLLLTDIIMPGMDGISFAQRLGDYSPGVKVLFMSGYSNEIIAKRGMLDPGTAFLEKPFAPVDLLRKIRRTLDD